MIPHLQRNGGGTIVTTSAYSVRAPKTLIAPYTSMKAAVLTMSKILAKTYGDDGIRVNVVCPGLFDTEVNDFIRQTRADQYGVPLEDAIYTHLSSNPAWNMRVALDRGGKTQRGRRADRVPARRPSRVHDRRGDQHRRRHRLLRPTAPRGALSG